MFIILAGVGARLSRRSTSHAGLRVTLSRGVRGWRRSLALRAARTWTTWGWRASSPPACRSHRSGSRRPLLPEGGCRTVCTGGPPTIPRAARAAFVFWGGPAFALGRRPCAEAGAPLVWEDLSGDLPGGWCPCHRRRGGGGSRSPRHRRDHCHHPRPGPLVLCTCPRPSSVGVGEGKIAAAPALRPALLRLGDPERGLLLP
jgi:hypothetical protein